MSGLPTENVVTLHDSTAHWGINRIAVTIVMDSTTEAQHLKLFNRLNAYLGAVLGTPAPL